jgi:hypothetical protein
MAEFMAASRGAANTGIALGATGLGVALLNGGLGNILGGCGCNNNCSENMPINRYELGQEQTIAKLQSEVALRDANIFTDQKIANTYAALNSDIRDLTSKVNDIDKTLAVKCAQVEGTFAVLGERMTGMQNTFMSALNREAEARCCGLNSLTTYVNATFTPKSIVGITPDTTNVTTQTTYNPIYNCGCGCNGR